MNSRGRPAPLPLPGSGKIYSVTEITRGVRNAIEDAFGVVIVQGEITGFKGANPASGHTYFSLKDASAMLSVVLYADRSTRAMLDGLANGLAVQIEGDLTVFEGRGVYQLRATRIQPVGYGALQARYDALKRKLEMEGLFAEDRKRALPRYPTRIGIVTSETAAVLHDMVRILRARAPYARIVFVDVRVQGEGSARDIAWGLRRMNERGDVDVILVGRGGGSMQDLWAFNEEVVVRAIVQSRIPIVSAVGHESDVTLADLAADRRAATPTHAAQLVVRDVEEIRKTLADMSHHARRRILAELAHARARLRGAQNHHAMKEPMRRTREGMQEIDWIRDQLSRALRDWVTVRRTVVHRAETALRGHAPGRALAHARDRVEGCRRGLTQAAAGGLARRRDRVESFGRLLGSFDHHQVLERGYALVWSEGRATLRKRGQELRPGDSIEVQFFDARAEARVTEILPESATPETSGKETS